jgi:hypothetical protein
VVADEPQFPIVMTLKPRNKLLVLGIAVFLVVAGIFAAGDDGTTRMPIIGHIPTSYFGMFCVALGLFIGLTSLNGMLRQRPQVMVTADGVTTMPNFAAPKRVLWDEVDRWHPYDGKYASGVSITTTSGKVIAIPALDRRGDELYDLLKRTATAAHKSAAPR